MREDEPEDEDDPEQRLVGGYVKRLREVRGLTQEVLAERSGLSADTIRAIGGHDPPLRTRSVLAEPSDAAQAVQGPRTLGVPAVPRVRTRWRR